MSENSSGTIAGQIFAAKNGIFLSKKTYPYKPATLKNTKNNKWYIAYYIYSEKKNKLVRRKRFVIGSTVQQKKEFAKQEIQIINELLRNGGHIDPIKEFRKQAEVPWVIALYFNILHDSINPTENLQLQ
ncbi:hypothetical protein DYBT9275_05513 [Dyadobacter sp. CECT 9275]|uniref:Uncharacterized protein n=1 Tax=Dyadobacter helix TaxID=2822344 RepID=A0A916JH90_9BACT|nr:hypothetical protein [Dyadobacter sp. CECT 9275]CAG5016261.1 hypothetical protein DYBT9275_05513 [Dyadobacter sp. CECT 9275]